MQQLSRDKFTSFLRATTEFTLCVLDRYGLHDQLPARPTLTPPIRFLYIGSRFCSTLPSDPASRRRPCASLSLLLYQDVKRTFTSKLFNMPGVPKEPGTTMVVPGDDKQGERKLFGCGGSFRHLQLGFRESPSNVDFNILLGGVAHGGELTNQQELCALEHFLFAEGERFCAAERDETLQNRGNFHQGTGAHAIGILFEAVFPIMVRGGAAFLEVAQNFAGLVGTNDGTQADVFDVGLRDHHLEATGQNAEHVVAL